MAAPTEPTRFMSPTLETIVSLCKRRGFIFQGSEIYGGLAATYDYGPLGVELKRNVKEAWWRTFVHQRDDMVGLDLSELESYYAGGEVAAPPLGTVTAGGPLLELPDDLPAGTVQEPMPLRKLLEVTHFHLFSMPVYLMILSHLFMLGRSSDRFKLLWIGIGTLATAGHIAAPWLARSGAASSALAYGLTGSGLLLSFAVMSVVPLWEMWGPSAAQ